MFKTPKGVSAEMIATAEIRARKERKPKPFGRESEMANAVTIFTDGACEPINPCGAAAAAFVAVNHANEIIHQDTKVIGVGRGMTNNLAELTAIAEALKWAESQVYKSVTILSDSKLSVNLLNSRWSANQSAAYYPAYQAARSTLIALREKGVKVIIKWTPRNEFWFNKVADELAFNAAKQAWDEFERNHPNEAKRLRRFGRFTGKEAEHLPPELQMKEALQVDPTKAAEPVGVLEPLETDTETFLAELEAQQIEPSTLPATQLLDGIACLCGGRLKAVGRSYRCLRCSNPLPAFCRECGRVLQVTREGCAECVNCRTVYVFDRHRRLWLSDFDAF
jgi:ribonuclease HI